MRMFQRPEDRMTEVAAAERQRSRAVAAHRRQSAATSRQAPGRCHPFIILSFLFSFSHVQSFSFSLFDPSVRPSILIPLVFHAMRSFVSSVPPHPGKSRAASIISFFFHFILSFFRRFTLSAVLSFIHPSVNYHSFNSSSVRLFHRFCHVQASGAAVSLSSIDSFSNSFVYTAFHSFIDPSIHPLSFIQFFTHPFVRLSIPPRPGKRCSCQPLIH